MGGELLNVSVEGPCTEVGRERERIPEGKGVHMQMDGGQGWGGLCGKGGKDGSADFVFEDLLGVGGGGGLSLSFPSPSPSQKRK